MRSSLLYAALSVAALLGSASACDGPTNATGASTSATASTSASAPESDVLVTVNGVPIRVSDLHYVLARSDHGRGHGVEEAKVKAALDKLIEQELARQQAEAMGLDEDPEYRRKLRFMEAPLNDFKRSTLSEMLFRKQVTEQAEVSDAEARKYFAANGAKLKTEVQLYQILVRGDDDKIRKLKEELDGGTPFEEVAATLFPKELPAGQRAPWDMGLLRYSQLPEPFGKAVEPMKEGDVSDILRGPKERAWIIKLVKRQVNDAITFEQVKPTIVETLKREKAAKLTEEAGQKLRSGAKIVRLREPDAMPPPAEPD